MMTPAESVRVTTEFEEASKAQETGKKEKKATRIRAGVAFAAGDEVMRHY